MKKSLLCIAVMTASLGLSACGGTLSEELEDQILVNQPEIGNDTGTSNDDATTSGDQSGTEDENGSEGGVTEGGTGGGVEGGVEGGDEGGDVAEGNVIEGDVVEDNSTEDNSTEDNSTEDNSTEDNSTEDNSTEDNSTEDNSTEDNSTEDNSNEVVESNGHTHPDMVGMDMDMDMGHGHDFLVSADDATLTSIKSGLWSDPATWGGDIPEKGERILISPDHIVVVDGVFEESFRTILVQGILNFSVNVNTELKVDTLLVASGGTYMMGSHDAPIQSQVVARLIIEDFNGEGIETMDSNSPDYDPYKMGLGVISMGKFITHGTEKETFATLNQAHSGDNSIKLDQIPSDWKVGDDIVIAGVQRDSKGEDARQIKALDRRSNLLMLDKSLEFDHVLPSHSKADLELKVHVINTTRNAIIETAEQYRTSYFEHDDKVGRFANTRELTNRGHVMFMGTNSVDVSYTGFYHLGRTVKAYPAHDTHTDEETGELVIGRNPKARYPLHFHRVGMKGESGYVLGNAIVNSPGFGLVNHSSNVKMRNNSAYNVYGSAFVAEAGDEVGDFIGNIAIKTQGTKFKGGPTIGHSSTRHEDLGFEGSGFWIQSRTVVMKDNIATGFSLAGFTFWNENIDNAGERMIRTEFIYDPFKIFENETEISLNTLVQKTPVHPATGNQSYGGQRGLNIHKMSVLRFSDFLTHSVNQGEVRWYAGQGKADKMTMIGDLENPQGTAILQHGNSGQFTFSNLHIEGFETGAELTPRQGTVVMHNAYMNNVIDFKYYKRWSYAHKATVSGDVNFGQLSNTALGDRERYNYAMVSAPSYGANAALSTMVIDTTDMAQPYRVYMLEEQDPSYIPFIAENMREGDIKKTQQDWLGKSNQWLLDNHNWTVAGELIPKSVEILNGSLNTGAVAIDKEDDYAKVTDPKSYGDAEPLFNLDMINK